ncbi:MAG TPA: FAD-dependent oxidoreductase, partial [Candidatus Methylomirabilis sp.]|nr:FAD-dependent oxidoreductase [Candidatus Methylomirabilis sp.]
MSHSRLFDAVLRAMRLGRICHETGITARSAIQRRNEAEEEAKRRFERRAFLGGIAAMGASAAAGLALPRAYAQGNPPSSARVAIIGGGLAGMTCADRLREKGVQAVIYEANTTRLGGRVYSNRLFPGMTAENGGELIDNGHKTLLHYANEFNLAREDLGKQPGEIVYYFFGQHYSEAEVVDEFRELVGRMHHDLQLLSGAPTFYDHTDNDVAFDQMSLADYLDLYSSDLPLARSALEQAYIAEYGREISEQSCLNFLFFIGMNRRSSFEPFGGSDERYHLVNGNDGIIAGIASRLPGPVVMGTRLTRLRRTAEGRYAMTFSGFSAEEFADGLVIAIPFSVLRNVVLDPSLGLSSDKLRAINELGYGYNAKTMIGFNSRPWRNAYGSNGTAYTDLANAQNTWETNPSATHALAILTDYSGGARGEALQLAVGGVPGSCGSCHIGAPSAKVINDTLIQGQVDAFLTDLDVIYPGAKAAATRTADGKYAAHRAHWLSQNTSRGSYTCYLPGQFTTIAGLESEPAGRLKFAGEHSDSFYM